MKFSRNVTTNLGDVAKQVDAKEVSIVPLSVKYAIPSFTGLKEKKVPIEEKIEDKFGIPEELIKEVKKEVEVAVVDINVEEVKDESWEKFVDHVIVSTLNSAVDKVKEFIVKDLAEDLKRSKPEIKD